MSTSYIGSKISLISKSEIRYEGILYTVDPKESTIALAKVKTFGTENRATEHPMPPRNDVFEYIIFKASDIKDIVVCETPQPVPQLYGGLPYDPAIVSVSKTAAPQNLQQQPLTNDLSLNATNAQKFVDNSRLSSRSITPVNHQKLISAYDTAPTNVPQNRAPGAGRRESNASAVGGGGQQHQKGGLGGAGAPKPLQSQRRSGGGANDDDDESVDDSRSRGSFHSRDAQFGLYRSRGMYRRGNTTRTGAFIRNDQEYGGGGGGGFRSGSGGGGNFDRSVGGGVRSAGRGVGSGFTHDFDRFRTAGGGRGGGGGYDRTPRGMTGGGAGNRFDQSNSHRMRGGGGGNVGGGGGFISRGFLSSRGGNRSGPGGGGNAGGGAAGQDGQNRRFDSDYDFEKANEKFQETMNHLREDVSKTKLDDSKENCSESSLPNASQVGGDGDDQKSKMSYNREKSFFDNISCEALETLDGGNSRPNWRRERELNQETFGQTGFRNYQFRRGVGRMGGGGGGSLRGGGSGGFRRGGTGGSGSGGFGAGGGGESRNY